MRNLLDFFSINIKRILYKYELDNLEEIKIRVDKPIILKYHDREEVIDTKIMAEDVLQTVSIMCDNSIYSYQKQICNGFITLSGGHRVGISGSVVSDKSGIININYISSLNFRVARQIIGCADEIIKHIICSNNSIYNTLIVSPPGCGKTTILRDLIRQISTGIEEYNFMGQTVGVVDERGEISAMYKAVPQNDLGLRTDVMTNVEKSLGIKMLIRSMNPRILCTDEIGSEQDISAINYAVCSGVNMIFTAHGKCFEDLISNPSLKKIIYKFLFNKIIFLTRTDLPGQIKDIYYLDIDKKKYYNY